MKQTLVLVMTLMFGLTLSVVLFADSDEGYGEKGYENEDYHDDDDRRGWMRRLFRGSAESPIAAYRQDPAFASYQSECGDCHLVYPPDMLPAVSWNTLTANLGEHFGDNAELEAQAAEEVAAFLERNSIAPMAIPLGAGESPPLRITETRWFRGKHHEIPLRVVAENPEVRSFARCEACHQRAAEGSFDEHEVRIPGYGVWDD